ncbi:hypothetical protein GUJ93_ZPchr0002g24809 [Zizania palustris]|uniref:Ribosomal RNA large subunit methyltransferase K/L-like methyltransferase domain-containing protein n=1 Tax=Zizania palustris TaxID=103762 RepID=A0A8J5VWU9_ZIZPA|nr:hypothetical protein GUJ93_ZPchr0002g24809 [Zizania palustris]
MYGAHGVPAQLYGEGIGGSSGLTHATLYFFPARPAPRFSSPLLSLRPTASHSPPPHISPSARLPASRWPSPRPPPASPPPGGHLHALRPPPRLSVATSVPSACLPASRWPPPHPPPGGLLRALRLPVAASTPPGGRLRVLRGCGTPRRRMDAEMAFLMANQGLAHPGKLVYDPFVGTGSILVAAAHYGAMTMGADIDIRVVLDGHGPDCNIWSNFEQYKLLEPLCVLRADNNVPPWRSGLKEIFDAIICDPPYGVRAGGRKSGGRKVIKGAIAPYTIPDEKRDNHIHFSIHNGVGAYV